VLDGRLRAKSQVARFAEYSGKFFIDTDAKAANENAAQV
jgi:hypothetical protein